MGWFFAGLIVLKALGIAFVILLVARIAAGVKSRWGHWDRASEILRGRLAAGEITEDQYRRLREVLDS